MLTELLLETIGEIVKADNKSRVKWWSREFIPKEAKEIVIRENLPSGKPPDGMYYHSKNITHAFFS
ncbi:hypothetical protein CROQUDRAFT_688517, partial [Cronartium quercuum f. sp. fusiforme G11]